MKRQIEIVAIYCPMCKTGTDCIAYLEGENKFTVTIRFICLSMCCNHKFTKKYTKGGRR